MARTLLALALLAGCTDAPEPVATLDAHADGPLELRRVGEGDFVAGETVSFEVVRTDGEPVGEVRWQVSEGELVSAGPRAKWTLPAEGGKQRIGVALAGQFLDFTEVVLGVRPPRAYTTAQQGEIVSNADGVVGDSCVLEFVGNTPHILYRNATHGKLHLAVWGGSSWLFDFVDGPGFGVGSVISERFDMAIDSGGDHHVAYAYADTQSLGYDWQVWWASDEGGSWTRELVNNDDGIEFTWPAIALDPVNGERPTVVWAQDYSSYDPAAIAWRTGPETWSRAVFSESNYSQYPMGAAAFTSDGVLHVSKGAYSYGYFNFTPATTTFSTATYVDYSTDGNYTYHHAVAVDDSDQPVFMHPEGLAHRVGTSFVHSEVEIFEMERFDLAWGGGKPHMAVLHDGNVELITTDADGYFEYTVVATGVDAAWPGVGVDADGDPHVCYQKGGALYYY